MAIDIDALFQDEDFKKLPEPTQREIVRRALLENTQGRPAVGLATPPGSAVQQAPTPSATFTPGSGIALGANGQPVFVEPGSTLTQPPPLVNTAVEQGLRIGVPTTAAYMTGGASIPVQLGGQLAATAVMQAIGANAPSFGVLKSFGIDAPGVEPYIDTLLTDLGTRFGFGAVREVVKGVLPMTNPGKLYAANQAEEALKNRLPLEKELLADTKAETEAAANRALGEGTQAQANQARLSAQQQEATGQLVNQTTGATRQAQAGREQALEGFTQGVQQDLATVKQLREQAQGQTGLIQDTLENINDGVKRTIALQKAQVQGLRAQGAVDARQWVEKLPVPDEATISKLYATVDSFNGNRVPPSVMDALNEARIQIAAKEARIASLVPEASNPVLQRVGQATSESVSSPPTFQAVRETLVRLGQKIGDARRAVNMGTTGASEELAAYSSLYGALQSSLEKAANEPGGTLTGAARDALKQANAAFKVQATVEDLRGLLEAKMRTPEGGSQIFNPGAVLDALQRPANKSLRTQLDDLGVLGNLETFLEGLQQRLAAPRDAITKARDLQQTARMLQRDTQRTSEAILGRLDAAKQSMSQRGQQATQDVQGEVAAIGQQGEARVGMLEAQSAQQAAGAQQRIAAIGEQAQAQADMLRAQGAQAAANQQGNVEDIVRQIGAIEKPTPNPGREFGLVPAAVGLMVPGAAALAGYKASVPLALGAAGATELYSLFSRYMMTPQGQKLVGRVMESSGGLVTPDALIVLMQGGKQFAPQALEAGRTVFPGARTNPPSP